VANLVIRTGFSVDDQMRSVIIHTAYRAAMFTPIWICAIPPSPAAHQPHTPPSLFRWTDVFHGAKEDSGLDFHLFLGWIGESPEGETTDALQ
jgi:hypothetical protein